MKLAHLPDDLDSYFSSIKRRLQTKKNHRKDIPPVFDQLRRVEFLTRNQFSPAKYTLSEKPKARPCKNTIAKQPDHSFQRIKRESILRQKRHSSTGLIQYKKSLVKIEMFQREQAQSRLRRYGPPKAIITHRPVLDKIQTEIKLELSSEKIQPREKIQSILSVRNHKTIQNEVNSPKPNKKSATINDEDLQTIQPPPPNRMPFKFLKKGENMRHFMAACFLKSEAKGQAQPAKLKDPNLKDRNKLHRLLGIFVGPVNGIKVGKDLQAPNPIVDMSQETQRRSASAWSRKRKTEGLLPEEHSKKIVGWENPQ